MTQPASAVSDAHADGKVSAILDDIKTTFRVPEAPPVWRTLATFPDYLVAAWAAIKPNVQTLYFERRSDALRRAAVEATTAFGTPPPVDASARSLLIVVHYAAPRFFLAGATLRSATIGAQPKMEYLAPEETHRVASGVPDGAAVIPSGDPVGSDERTRAVLEDIVSSSGPQPLGLEFRALTGSPEYLDSAWSAIKPVLKRPEYREAQHVLRMTAERAITAFPFRMDLGSHVLRHTGLSEAEIDEIREILDSSYTGDGNTLINAAFLATGLSGREAAMQSPFPAELARSDG